MNKISTIFSNSIGIAGSFLCLIHCLASPMLMIIGMKFLLNPYVKYIFLIMSFGAIYDATRHNTDTKTAAFLWVSFTIFMFSTLFMEEYEWLHIISYISSVLVIIGHIINLIKCKNCKI
jgi:hypothetical protein